MTPGATIWVGGQSDGERYELDLDGVLRAFDDLKLDPSVPVEQVIGMLSAWSYRVQVQANGREFTIRFPVMRNYEADVRRKTAVEVGDGVIRGWVSGTPIFTKVLITGPW